MSASATRVHASLFLVVEPQRTLTRDALFRYGLDSIESERIDEVEKKFPLPLIGAVIGDDGRSDIVRRD